MPVSRDPIGTAQETRRTVHPRAARPSKRATSGRCTGRASRRAACASCCRCCSSSAAAARKLGRRLRKVTDRLGTVRELDVLLLLIDELHVSGRRGSGGLGRVGVRVSKSRDEARKRLFARAADRRRWRAWRASSTASSTELQEAERASSKTAARSWRWAIDARVARRAARLAVGDGGGRRAVPARAAARRAHRGEEAALRGRARRPRRRANAAARTCAC